MAADDVIGCVDGGETTGVLRSTDRLLSHDRHLRNALEEVRSQGASLRSATLRAPHRQIIASARGMAPMSTAWGIRGGCYPSRPEPPDDRLADVGLPGPRVGWPPMLGELGAEPTTPQHRCLGRHPVKEGRNRFRADLALRQCLFVAAGRITDPLLAPVRCPRAGRGDPRDPRRARRGGAM